MDRRFKILRDNGNGSLHVQLEVHGHKWASADEPAVMICDVHAENFEKELTVICDGFCADLECRDKEFVPVKLPLKIGETYTLGKIDLSDVAVLSAEAEII